jgi:septal ring factor EnvC (AmiA/AmiB activator)
LLNVNELQDLGRAYRTVATLAALDRRRAAEHKQSLEALRRAQRTLDERRVKLAATEAAAKRDREALNRTVAARTALVKQIDARRDLNAQLTGELQAAQQKLQLALRDIGSGVAVADPTPLPVRSFRGALDWPVAGQLRRRFGRGTGPRVIESKGVEIAANEGTNVQAVHEGTVAFADPFSGFGNLVILDHGGQIFSLYGDLLDITVKKGARIERGQPIGSVGSSPTGAAGLYFEIRVDGQPVDPLEWLKRR